MSSSTRSQLIVFNFQNRNGKEKYFQIRISKTYSTGNFNKKFFPLLTVKQEIPLRLLIHYYISLNIFTGEGLGSVKKGGINYGLIRRFQRAKVREDRNSPTEDDEIHRNVIQDNIEDEVDEISDPGPSNGNKSSYGLLQKGGINAPSHRNLNSSSRPRGIQNNGTYIFPQSESNKNNFIVRKIYQIAGLGFPGFKLKFNTRFFDMKTLKQYLSKYIEQIPKNEGFSLEYKYIILYIRMLTNLWTFLMVKQDRKDQKLIYKYLINEIGKLRKHIQFNNKKYIDNNSLYMVNFIEKANMYSSELFYKFVRKLTDTVICDHDIKEINSRDATKLHFKLLTVFDSLTAATHQQAVVGLQKYILYSALDYDNASSQKMNTNNIKYNFRYAKINRETCEINDTDIHRNMGDDDDEDSDNNVDVDGSGDTQGPLVILKCRKIRRKDK